MGLFSRKNESEHMHGDMGDMHGMHHAHAAGSETDPICGMSVDPATAAAKRDYNGKTYYFCGAGCAAAFDKNPAQYAK